jgi:hypothetical protein
MNFLSKGGVAIFISVHGFNGGGGDYSCNYNS